MMTPPSDNHTLNACLARVIGRKISEVKIGTHPNHVYTWMVFEANQWIKWNPLHDANQMEEVEAWLVENGYEFGSAWSKSDGYYTAHVLLDPNPSGDPRILYRTAIDPDKKRAFALAVWEMEQSQKGGVSE